MKGKLIIIESGSDASGKATQAALLYDRLSTEGHNVIKVEYPNYKSDSSALIKMYLNGEFGKNPEDVNPYVASTFYAVDRYASYKKDWQDFYLSGGIVIADRYTTSNMVHQAAKIKDDSQKAEYLEWLWDLEFIKFGLPIPDCVFFLNMPPQYSLNLISYRNNKFTGSSAKDIHEKNDRYLSDSYNNGIGIAEKYEWVKIECVRDGKIKAAKEIHEELFSKLHRYL